MQRFTFVLLASVAALVTGCDGRPLSGPEAQQAFRDGAPAFASVPAGTLVFLNKAGYERPS